MTVKITSDLNPRNPEKTVSQSEKPMALWQRVLLGLYLTVLAFVGVGVLHYTDWPCGMGWKVEYTFSGDRGVLTYRTYDRLGIWSKSGVAIWEERATGGTRYSMTGTQTGRWVHEDGGLIPNNVKNKFFEDSRQQWLRSRFQDINADTNEGQ